MKDSHNKFSDPPDTSGDAGNDNLFQNIEEKSSLSSDEYENNKVSDSGSLHEEHIKPPAQDTSLQSHHTDGIDQSDDVDNDVKLCDTCGDSGNEDLIAICSKCPDGAEHIYCMRVVKDKVPEGDWVCEECVSENIRNTNQQKNSTDSDSTAVKVSGKRRAEELLSSSSFNKQSFEVTGSTKDVDHGKVKPTPQFSSDAHFGNESLEGSRSPATRSRVQSLQGGFSKSNSFSFPNPKSKTKLLDEGVLQRQKSTKEQSSHNAIAPKEISKSMPFRSTNSGRFGASNSKVKMLSPTSPTKVGTSSSGTINSVEQKPVDTSSKATSKESTNPADVSKEDATGLNPGPPAVSCQNNKQSAPSAQGSFGNNASAIKSLKDVKNGDNKLKDAIEAALLKKPGIYRKNKVSDQPDESSVAVMNKEASIVDRVPHLRNAGSLTSADVASTDWHGQISRTSIVDHSKQSNGNNHKQPMILPADVALSSLLNTSAFPNYEYIWQGSFEINRSGKTAGFWDGLQAHLSTCASPRVFEAVNKFPRKILLNGVSRASAWPRQFKDSGVKEDNIALYFFAKDLESYEKSYLVLLDDMIKSDLALIGSVNGVELLIFPSNQLPEKSNRWNMLFFLWGVFRGKKKNSSHHIPDNPEKNRASQSLSSLSADKIMTANASLMGSFEKDEHVDLESKVVSVNVVPASSKEIISENNAPNESKKRTFIDLSEDVDFEGTSQTNTWRDVSGQTMEEESSNKKQKSDSYGENSNLEIGKSDVGNSNGERCSFSVDRGKAQREPVFALDLNEDITCLVGDDDDVTMTKKDDDDGDDVAPLSLSLAFSPAGKQDDVDGRGKA